MVIGNVFDQYLTLLKYSFKMRSEKLLWRNDKDSLNKSWKTTRTMDAIIYFLCFGLFFFSGKFKKYIASSSPSGVNLRCKSKKGNARGISFFICFSHVVVVKVFLGGDDLAIVRGWNMTLRGSSREPFQTKQYLFIAFSEEPCQSIGG